jgi:hypothetical protein
LESAEDLHETVRGLGDISVYIDMRTVGSTGGIYADVNIPLAERATRLLADTLAGIHDSVMELAVESNNVDLAALSPILDQLADGIAEVVVVGNVETEKGTEASFQQTERSGSALTFTTKEAGVRLEDQRESVGSGKDTGLVRESGILRNRIHFGSVGQCFERLTKLVLPRKIWVLLDEWSSVPLELQPYLADLVRRALLPHAGIIVKIGAIEQRTQFRLGGYRGDYIGLELGADIAANLNLDDFMVFENDSARATFFFQQLLFKHFKSVEDTSVVGVPTTSAELVQVAFTQWNAFEEYTRAAEGVPRDAINILSTAAQKAFADPISIPHVRAAARTWYQRDKEAAVVANRNAQALLHWVIDEVIAHRRARAFLLRTDVRHDLIDTLFDARVLHLLKRNVSAHDQPGVRYDVYKLDYGCYVDLFGTMKSPLGLLGADDGSFVSVPPDDYRAIRRAILELQQFERTLSTTARQEGGWR